MDCDELALIFVDAWLRRDFTALEMVLAHDAIVSMHLPHLDTVYGRARFLSHMRAFDPPYTIDSIHIDVLSASAAVAHGVLRFEVGDDPARHRLQRVFWHFESRDGELTRLRIIDNRQYDQLLRTRVAESALEAV